MGVEPIPVTSKVAAILRGQLSDELVGLRHRRARLAAEDETLQADTARLLMAGQAAEPPISYDDLSELTGLSRSRVAQVIRDEKKRLEALAKTPAGRAKARAAGARRTVTVPAGAMPADPDAVVPQRGVPVAATIGGKGGVAVATTSAEAEAAEAAAAGAELCAVELAETDTGTVAVCTVHGWRSEPATAEQAALPLGALVEALVAPHEAELPAVES